VTLEALIFLLVALAFLSWYLWYAWANDKLPPRFATSVERRKNPIVYWLYVVIFSLALLSIIAVLAEATIKGISN